MLHSVSKNNPQHRKMSCIFFFYTTTMHNARDVLFIWLMYTTYDTGKGAFSCAMTGSKCEHTRSTMNYDGAYISFCTWLREPQHFGCRGLCLFLHTDFLCDKSCIHLIKDNKTQSTPPIKSFLGTRLWYISRSTWLLPFSTLLTPTQFTTTSKLLSQFRKQFNYSSGFLSLHHISYLTCGLDHTIWLFIQIVPFYLRFKMRKTIASRITTKSLLLKI